MHKIELFSYKSKNGKAYSIFLDEKIIATYYGEENGIRADDYVRGMIRTIKELTGIMAEYKERESQWSA